MTLFINQIELHPSGHTGYLAGTAFPLLERGRLDDELQASCGRIRVQFRRETLTGYLHYYAAVGDLPPGAQAGAARGCVSALWKTLEKTLDPDRMLLEPHWALQSTVASEFVENLGTALATQVVSEHARVQRELEVDRAHARGGEATHTLLLGGDMERAYAQYRFTPESWSRFERDAPDEIPGVWGQGVLPGQSFSRSHIENFYDSRDIPGVFEAADSDFSGGDEGV